jgi:transposase
MDRTLCAQTVFWGRIARVLPVQTRFLPIPRSSKYPEQFRRDAVELVRASAAGQVARDLGVNHETLRNWVKTAEKLAAQPSGGSATTGPDELRTPA